MNKKNLFGELKGLDERERERERGGGVGPTASLSVRLFALLGAENTHIRKS